MIGIEVFVRGLPKTDLHMHIEGSIEPQLCWTSPPATA